MAGSLYLASHMGRGRFRRVQRTCASEYSYGCTSLNKQSSGAESGELKAERASTSGGVDGAIAPSTVASQAQPKRLEAVGPVSATGSSGSDGTENL